MIVLATIVALLTAAAIMLSSKLPKPAAAQHSIDPAIVTATYSRCATRRRCPKSDEQSLLPAAIGAAFVVRDHGGH